MKSIQQYIQQLEQDQLLAYPTETVWGLGCQLTPKAIAQVYEYKKRETQKPLSLLVASVEMAAQYVEINHKAAVLLDIFWPGPVTFILPAKNSDVASLLNAPGSIGLRVSSHSFVELLLKKWQKPLITTSLNISGENELKTRDEVQNKTSASLLKVDSSFEDSYGALPSTLVKIEGSEIQILREGNISKKMILDVYYRI